MGSVDFCSHIYLTCYVSTLDSGIKVGQGINLGFAKIGKNNLKLINLRPTSISESAVYFLNFQS